MELRPRTVRRLLEQLERLPGIGPRSARSLVEHLLTVDRGIELEVEAFQRFGGVERGAPDTQSQLALGAPFDFVFEQASQELTIGPVFVNCLPVARVEGFQDTGQPQVPEGRQEITTEGGLDLSRETQRLCDVVKRLADGGVVVSASAEAMKSARYGSAGWRTS